MYVEWWTPVTMRLPRERSVNKQQPNHSSRGGSGRWMARRRRGEAEAEGRGRTMNNIYNWLFYYGLVFIYLLRNLTKSNYPIQLRWKWWLRNVLTSLCWRSIESCSVLWSFNSSNSLNRLFSNFFVLFISHPMALIRLCISSATNLSDVSPRWDFRLEVSTDFMSDLEWYPSVTQLFSAIPLTLLQ